MKRISEQIFFDDLDIELIHVIIRLFSTWLKIRGNVSLIDEDQMLSIYYEHLSKKEFENEKRELRFVFGSSFPEDRTIYINPRICKRNYSVLIETIIHELLHVKYPEKSESDIQKLESQYTGRYDYKHKNEEEIRCMYNG